MKKQTKKDYIILLYDQNHLRYNTQLIIIYYTVYFI